jgi:hypothetical protein
MSEQMHEAAHLLLKIGPHGCSRETLERAERRLVFDGGWATFSKKRLHTIVLTETGRGLYKTVKQEAKND